MQKVGYYKLHHLDIQAGNWMLVIDASIQLGDQKCLVVLGCRMDDLSKDRGTTLKDLACS